MTEEQFILIAEWQKQTFPSANELSKIAHLQDELLELTEAIKNNDANRRLEFADCFFLLFGAAAVNGMTYTDICHAIEEKFEINRNRTWGKPNRDGVVNHIKS